MPKDIFVLFSDDVDIRFGVWFAAGEQAAKKIHE
jgi:hypothetical protein